MRARDDARGVRAREGGAGPLRGPAGDQRSAAVVEVAERAGVGLRTVFRHFQDMDSLYREMSAVIEREYMAVVERPFEGRTWRDRVLELVRRRAGVYEKIAPYKQGSNVHRHRSPFLQADHARLVQTSRDILRRELPPELAEKNLQWLRGRAAGAETAETARTWSSLGG